MATADPPTPDEVCGTLNTHCTEFVNFWDRTASLSTMELSKRKGALEVCLGALITTLHRYQLSHRGYFYEHLNLEHPSIITINIPSRFRLQDQIIPLLAEVFFVRFTSASADLCNPEDLEEERLSCVGALVAVKAAISALKMRGITYPAKSTGRALEDFIGLCRTHSSSFAPGPSTVGSAIDATTEGINERRRALRDFAIQADEHFFKHERRQVTPAKWILARKIHAALSRAVLKFPVLGSPSILLPSPPLPAACIPVADGPQYWYKSRIVTDAGGSYYQASRRLYAPDPSNPDEDWDEWHDYEPGSSEDVADGEEGEMENEVEVGGQEQGFSRGAVRPAAWSFASVQPTNVSIGLVPSAPSLNSSPVVPDSFSTLLYPGSPSDTTDPPMVNRASTSGVSPTASTSAAASSNGVSASGTSTSSGGSSSKATSSPTTQASLKRKVPPAASSITASPATLILSQPKISTPAVATPSSSAASNSAPPGKKARADSSTNKDNPSLTNFGKFTKPAPSKSSKSRLVAPPQLVPTKTKPPVLLGVNTKVRREGLSAYLTQDMATKEPLLKHTEIKDLPHDGIFHALSDETTGTRYLLDPMPKSVNKETENIGAYERVVQSSEYPAGGSIFDLYAIMLRNFSERVFWSIYSMTRSWIETFFGGDLVRPFFEARLDGFHTMIHFTMCAAQAHLVRYLIVIDKLQHALNKADPRYKATNKARRYDHAPFFTWDFFLAPGTVASRHDKAFLCSMRLQQIIAFINTSANASTVGMALSRLFARTRDAKVSDESAQLEFWPMGSADLEKMLFIISATLCQKGMSGSVVDCTPDMLKYDPVTAAARDTDQRVHRARLARSSAANSRRLASQGPLPAVVSTHKMSHALLSKSLMRSQPGLSSILRDSLKFNKVLPPPLEADDIVLARSTYAAIVPAVNTKGVFICMVCLCQWVGRLRKGQGVNSRNDRHPQATCETDECRVEPTLGHGLVFIAGASINDRAVLDIIDTVKDSSIVLGGITVYHLLYTWYNELDSVISGPELFTNVLAFLERPKYSTHPQVDYLRYILRIPKVRGHALYTVFGSAFTSEVHIGALAAGGEITPNRRDLLLKHLIDPTGMKAKIVIWERDSAKAALLGAQAPLRPVAVEDEEPDEDNDEEEAADVHDGDEQ